mmetsp:Transcript_40892/g.127380  ORF Transcript_40892/g.127380 Transcript_40892/m.127380 type:complete len:475 (+) Transcript_40892:75-1499(+)
MRVPASAWLLLLGAAPRCGAVRLGTGRGLAGPSTGFEASPSTYASDLARFAAELQRAAEPQQQQRRQQQQQQLPRLEATPNQPLQRQLPGLEATPSQQLQRQLSGLEAAPGQQLQQLPVLEAAPSQQLPQQLPGLEAAPSQQLQQQLPVLEAAPGQQLQQQLPVLEATPSHQVPQQLPPLEAAPSLQPQQQLPSLEAAGTPAAVAQPSSQGIQALPEWAPADPSDAFSLGKAAGLRQEEAFNLAGLQKPSQALLPSTGPADWITDFRQPEQPAAFDMGVLGKEAAQVQRLPTTPAVEEEMALMETRSPTARAAAGAETALEAQIASASQAAGTLAHDAAVLSQELNKLGGILRGGSEGRSEREALGLLALAPPPTKNATAAAAAAAAGSTGGLPSVMAMLSRGFAGNTTNATQLDDKADQDDEHKGFSGFFTLGNKIHMGWAVVFWLVCVIVCTASCVCCCGRLRRTGVYRAFA